MSTDQRARGHRRTVHRRGWAAALVVVGLLVALAAPAAAAPGTVSGTVTDADGMPLAGVLVTSSSYNGYGSYVFAVTGEDGTYSLAVGAGDAYVQFQKTGYVTEYYDDSDGSTEPTVVEVPSGGTVEGIDAELGLGGSVRGHLTLDPAPSGDGYFQTSICLEPVGSAYSYNCTGVDAVGDWWFDSLPPGDYRVRYSAYAETTSYQTIYHPGVVQPADAEPVTVEAGEVVDGLEATLRERSRVQGAITDPNGAGQWADVTVYVEGDIVAGTVSSPDGQFTAYVPPGDPFCIEVDPVAPILASWWSGGGSMEDCELAALEPGQALEVPVGLDWWTRFSDVPVGHTFAGDIAWMVEEGIAGGYDDGTYRPTTPVSRGGLAVMLWRRAGSPTPSGPPVTFDDVPEGSPFSGAVRWLVTSGAATGYDDNTFRPGAPVSRQALASFLWKLAGSPPVSGATTPFPDVPASSPFAPAVTWLVGTGATTGYADGTFGAALPVTRQAVSAFLHRLNGPDRPGGWCCSEVIEATPVAVGG